MATRKQWLEQKPRLMQPWNPRSVRKKRKEENCEEGLSFVDSVKRMLLFYLFFTTSCLLLFCFFPFWCVFFFRYTAQYNQRLK